MAVSQPVLGYPSKAAAIDALFLSGMKPNYIAIEVGSTPAAVRSRIKEARRLGQLPPGNRPGRKTLAERAEADAARDTRGIWTPEKLEKAHRLFGKTMLLIAEALEVPPNELLEYGLKGVLPPMGEGQRVAALLEDLSKRENEDGDDALGIGVPETAAGSADPAGQETLAAPAADPVGEEVEPDRDDDEAELARLAALEDEDDGETEPVPVEPGGAAGAGVSGPGDGSARAAAGLARGDGEGEAAGPESGQGGAPTAAPRPAAAPEPGHEYYLTDEAGQWLHESLEALTKNRKYAWKGTTKKIGIVLQRMPKWKVLVPERVR